MAGRRKGVRLSLEEARALQLIAQGLDSSPCGEVTADDLLALIDRLGVVQVDTISVVERAQLLTLWARLGAYDPALLDQLLYPRRAIFEYWAHAASILPMGDYRFYRLDMLRPEKRLYQGDHHWLRAHPDVVEQTLATIRARGPMASADFERPQTDRRPEAWDWFGLKESRRALHVLWTTGDLMVHSRRGGQKVFDLRERVLREAFGRVPRDSALPSVEDQLRHFARRTINALGVVTPTWLWDYYRIAPEEGSKRASGEALLDELVRSRVAVPAEIEGIAGPAYIARERLADLDGLRAGSHAPSRTTLLPPFDNLIWDRARARALFGYEVCFEAYVVPEKRRYGYYCLAILHRGQLVGRVDPKMDRAEGTLRVRGLFLEPGVVADDALAEGLDGALRDLARFLGANRIAIESATEPELTTALRERLNAAESVA